MSENNPCPSCSSEFAYSTVGELMMCPECGHEWKPAEAVQGPIEEIITDANVTRLADGDSIIVLKNPPVKGMPKPVEAVSKVKNIRLTDGVHNTACKIDGFGSMGLKSEFVQKHK